LSELTSQTIPTLMRISQNYPATSVKSENSMREGDGFSAKTLRRSLFHCQKDLSGNGLGGQF